MDVDEVVVAAELDAPQLVEEVLPADDDPRLPGEQREEVELERGQLDGAAVDPDRPPPGVEEA